MKRRLKIICAALCIAAMACPAATADEIQPVREKLGQYNIDIGKSSVSGLSAGGFLANQFFVAYSGILSGAGVFAGGPYGCARGDVFKAVRDCMSAPDLLTYDVLSELTANARALASQGRIDPLENLKTKKVFLVSGRLDRTVRPGVVDRARDEFLKLGLPPGHLRYENTILAGHALPTVGYGNPCDTVSAPPWMSACGYDGAGEALKHIYGILNPPAPVTRAGGKLIEFDQKDFVDPPRVNAEDLAREISLNEFGYAYVPKACQMGEVCRIHVVFHGCRQMYNQDPEGRDLTQGGKAFGLQMVLHAGYNEWANTNHIIVLYPQAQKNKVNPNGCFDWWGYLGGAKDEYLTKDAPQMKAVRAMMKALSGK